MVSRSQPCADGDNAARTEAQPPAAYPHNEIVSELSFVIAERLATINSIQRERKETEKVKAIRISICQKMIERTQAARAMVEAFPALLEALQAMVDAEVEYMTRNLLGDPEKQHNVIQARAAIARALGLGDRAHKASAKANSGTNPGSAQ